MTATILLIEDGPTIRMTTEFSLTHAGYAVSSCTDGEEGLKAALNIKPDLILLDLMLPKLNGFEVAGRLRQTDHETPIIMLTALDRDEDKIRGLDAGADDCVTKPFSTDVLLARIRANMRRADHGITDEPCPESITVGDLEIDTGNARIKIKSEVVSLRGKEYALLVALAHRPGALCTREWLSIFQRRIDVP